MGRKVNNKITDTTNKTELRADFSGGINITDAPQMLASNELVSAINVNLDERGKIVKRPGLKCFSINGVSLDTYILSTLENLYPDFKNNSIYLTEGLVRTQNAFMFFDGVRNIINYPTNLGLIVVVLTEDNNGIEKTDKLRGSKPLVLWYKEIVENVVYYKDDKYHMLYNSHPIRHFNSKYNANNEIDKKDLSYPAKMYAWNPTNKNCITDQGMLPLGWYELTSMLNDNFKVKTPVTQSDILDTPKRETILSNEFNGDDTFDNSITYWAQNSDQDNLLSNLPLSPKIEPNYDFKHDGTSFQFKETYGKYNNCWVYKTPISETKVLYHKDLKNLEAKDFVPLQIQCIDNKFYFGGISKDDKSNERSYNKFYGFFYDKNVLDISKETELEILPSNLCLDNSNLGHHVERHSDGPHGPGGGAPSPTYYCSTVDCNFTYYKNNGNIIKTLPDLATYDNSVVFPITQLIIHNTEDGRNEYGYLLSPTVYTVGLMGAGIQSWNQDRPAPQLWFFDGAVKVDGVYFGMDDTHLYSYDPKTRFLHIVSYNVKNLKHLLCTRNVKTGTTTYAVRFFVLNINDDVVSYSFEYNTNTIRLWSTFSSKMYIVAHGNNIQKNSIYLPALKILAPSYKNSYIGFYLENKEDKKYWLKKFLFRFEDGSTNIKEISLIQPSLVGEEYTDVENTKKISLDDLDPLSSCAILGLSSHLDLKDILTDDIRGDSHKTRATLINMLYRNHLSTSITYLPPFGRTSRIAYLPYSIPNDKVDYTFLSIKSLSFLGNVANIYNSAVISEDTYNTLLNKLDTLNSYEILLQLKESFNSNVFNLNINIPKRYLYNFVDKLHKQTEDPIFKIVFSGNFAKFENQNLKFPGTIWKLDIYISNTSSYDWVLMNTIHLDDNQYLFAFLNNNNITFNTQQRITLTINGVTVIHNPNVFFITPFIYIPAIQDYKVSGYNLLTLDDRGTVDFNNNSNIRLHTDILPSLVRQVHKDNWTWDKGTTKNFVVSGILPVNALPGEIKVDMDVKFKFLALSKTSGATFVHKTISMPTDNYAEMISDKNFDMYKWLLNGKTEFPGIISSNLNIPVGSKQWTYGYIVGEKSTNADIIVAGSVDSTGLLNFKTDESTSTLNTTHVFKSFLFCDKAIVYKSYVIFYGKCNKLFFSDSFNKTYFGMLNYLSLNTQDEIIKCKVFNSILVIFTKTRIYKITGSQLESINATDPIVLTDTGINAGCIAPNSCVSSLNNLMFLDDSGLKIVYPTQLAVANELSVRSIDHKINSINGSLITPINSAISCLYNDRVFINFPTEENMYMLVYSTLQKSWTIYQSKYMKFDWMDKINSELYMISKDNFNIFTFDKNAYVDNWAGDYEKWNEEKYGKYPLMTPYKDEFEFQKGEPIICNVQTPPFFCSSITQNKHFHYLQLFNSYTEIPTGFTVDYSIDDKGWIDAERYSFYDGSTNIKSIYKGYFIPSFPILDHGVVFDALSVRLNRTNKNNDAIKNIPFTNTIYIADGGMRCSFSITHKFPSGFEITTMAVKFNYKGY